MRLQRQLALLLLATSSLGAQVRVNVGGPPFIDPSGNVWQADTGCTSTGTYTYPSAITGTDSPTLYQTGRTATSSIGCSYSATPGNFYFVTFKFAEYNPQMTNGKRLLNLFINGQRYQTAFDAAQRCGFASACDIGFGPVPISGNTISVLVTQQQGQAMLAAIEIEPVNGALSTSYNLGVQGSQVTTVAAKLNTYYEAVADFGADPTGATDSTTAIQSAVTAQIANGRSCVHLQAGTYKVSNASGVGSIILSSTATNNACIRGDGPGQTNILQNTNGGTTIAVQGANTIIRDLFIAKEAGVTGGTGISLYPDVTASGIHSQVEYTNIDNVTIDSAYCNVGSDYPGNACLTAANSNRLTYGIILQSGAQDTVYNSISHTKVFRAGICFYQISGGLAGSAGAGAVNANHYTDDYATSCTDAGLRLDSSGENTVSNFTVDYSTNEIRLDVQTAGLYANGNPPSGNIIESAGEGSTNILNIAAAGFNFYRTPRSGIYSSFGFIGAALKNISIQSGDNFWPGMYGLSDGFLNIGKLDFPYAPPTATFQVNETTNVPEVLRVTNKAAAVSNNQPVADSDYLHINPYGASLAGGTYTSGITTTGTTGQTCKITITSGSVNAVVSVNLTGTNTIAGGTALLVLGGSAGVFTSAPTAGAASAGSATACSGTATIATTITLPGSITRTASSYPATQPVAFDIQGNGGASTTQSVCRELDISTTAVTTYGTAAMAQFCGQYVGTGSTAATIAKIGAVNSSSSIVYPHGWGGDGIDRNNLSVAFSALPTCNSTTVMWTANINNSNSVTPGAAAAGGGSANSFVRCDLALDGSTYAWHIH